jgi:hypothetical protein
MSSSVVQICNLALYKFGNLSITALTDATKEARACKVLYPQMRDELLYAHPWNFAMGRADISAQIADEPAFGYDYAYTIPTDCLRVWELYGYDGEWEVESGELLTDKDSEIYIRYIKAVEDSGKFNPAFVGCLSTRLAAELASKLADDKKMREALLSTLYRVELPMARALNAIEGNKKLNKGSEGLDKGNFTWQTEGR